MYLATSIFYSDSNNKIMMKIAINMSLGTILYIVKFEISKKFEWKCYIILNKYSEVY